MWFVMAIIIGFLAGRAMVRHWRFIVGSFFVFEACRLLRLC